MTNSLFSALRKAGVRIVEVDFPSTEERINPDETGDSEHGTPDKSERIVAKIDGYYGINDYSKYLSNIQTRSVEDIVVYNNLNTEIEGASGGIVPAFRVVKTTLWRSLTPEENKKSLMKTL